MSTGNESLTIREGGPGVAATCLHCGVPIMEHARVVSCDPALLPYAKLYGMDPTQPRGVDACWAVFGGGWSCTLDAGHERDGIPHVGHGADGTIIACSDPNRYPAEG